MTTRTQASNQADATGPIVMDSRRFLGAINSSLQARVSHVESLVRDLGRRVGANWRLAALRGDSLFIEDCDSHDYYLAAHRREKGGRLVIENVRPIKIVESKKRSLFEQSCVQLVNALEENDQKGMAAAYNRMIGQRFSARTIPLTGRVRTQDGVVRTVPVARDELLGEDLRRRLVAAIIDGVSDRVVVREGRVVSATFNTERFKLPINEWTCRKAVARQMRRVAENAYWSKGFQDRVYAVARLIHEDKIVDAVRLVSGFLAENQEFTLLNRKQLQRLIENSLATKAVFNQQLCTDTAQLFWRTNLKVNRRSIIDEWRATARKAAHSTLLENVRRLEESKNFEQAYESFINMVFNEAVGPREVQVDAYKTALKALKETPQIKNASELSGKIDELIERLDQPEADHAVIAEVEDLLAEVKNEMNALQNLDNFDQIPGSTAGGGAGAAGGGAGAAGGSDASDLDDLLGGADAAGAGSKGTTVNFNININGEGVHANGVGGNDEGGDSADLLGGDEGNDKGSDEGGDDLASLLGGAGGQQGNPRLANKKPNPLLQDRDRGPAVAEGVPPWRRGRGNAKERPWRDDEEPTAAEMRAERGDHDDDDGAPEDVKHLRAAKDPHEDVDGDPYAFSEGEQRPVYATGVGSDYGLKPIRVHEDCIRAVRAMFNLAAKHRLTGPAIGENLEKLAVAGMQAAGLRIPARRRDDAIRQVCEVFVDECGRRVALGEDQYRWDWAYKGGRRRQRYTKPANPRRLSEVASEGVRWLKSENDGILGEMAGIRFIFDHGRTAQLEPVILSEDGQVEVPIPAELHNSAFAAARLEQGDPQPFLEWLASNLTQLRPISEAERAALDEAVVKITTGADGQVEIEVDSDEGITFDGDEGGDLISEPGEHGGVPGGELAGEPTGDSDDNQIDADDGLGAEAGDGMEPVETMPGAEGGGEEADDELPTSAGPHDMPDFDDDADERAEEEGEGAEEEGHAGGHGPAKERTSSLGDSHGPPATQEGGEGSDAGGGEEGAPSAARGRGVTEDYDMTDPESSKYTYQAIYSNPRQGPEVHPAPKGDNELKGFSTDGGDRGADTGTGAAKLKKIVPRGSKGGDKKKK